MDRISAERYFCYFQTPNGINESFCLPNLTPLPPPILSTSVRVRVRVRVRVCVRVRVQSGLPCLTTSPFHESTKCR